MLWCNLETQINQLKDNICSDNWSWIKNKRHRKSPCYPNQNVNRIYQHQKWPIINLQNIENFLNFSWAKNPRTLHYPSFFWERKHPSSFSLFFKAAPFSTWVEAHPDGPATPSLSRMPPPSLSPLRLGWVAQRPTGLSLWGYDPWYPQGCTRTEPLGEAQPTRLHMGHATSGGPAYKMMPREARRRSTWLARLREYPWWSRKPTKIC